MKKLCFGVSLTLLFCMFFVKSTPAQAAFEARRYDLTSVELSLDQFVPVLEEDCMRFSFHAGDTELASHILSSLAETFGQIENVPFIDIRKIKMAISDFTGSFEGFVCFSDVVYEGELRNWGFVGKLKEGVSSGDFRSTLSQTTAVEMGDVGVLDFETPSDFPFQPVAAIVPLENGSFFPGVRVFSLTENDSVFILGVPLSSDDWFLRQTGMSKSEKEPYKITNLPLRLSATFSKETANRQLKGYLEESFNLTRGILPDVTKNSTLELGIGAMEKQEGYVLKTSFDSQFIQSILDLPELAYLLDQPLDTPLVTGGKVLGMVSYASLLSKKDVTFEEYSSRLLNASGSEIAVNVLFVLEQLQKMGYSWEELRSILSSNVALTVGGNSSVLMFRIPGFYVSFKGIEVATGVKLMSDLQTILFDPEVMSSDYKISHSQEGLWNCIVIESKSVVRLKFLIAHGPEGLIAGLLDKDSLKAKPIFPQEFAKYMTSPTSGFIAVDVQEIQNSLRFVEKMTFLMPKTERQEIEEIFRIFYLLTDKIKSFIVHSEEDDNFMEFLIYTR